MFVGNIFEVSMSFWCLQFYNLVSWEESKDLKSERKTQQQWQLILSLEELQGEYILYQGYAESVVA